MNKSRINSITLVSLIFTSLLAFSSCAHKSGRHRKDSASRLKSERIDRKIGSHTKVNMRQENGVYFVPITVNGLNLDFVFDTGASSISLSSAEATVMLRQGKITDDDIVGQNQFQDATGSISVGTVVLLRTVQIGDITLENVEASVVDNIQAPLLLGQTALSKFGKVTIDYNNNTIEFN